MAANVGGVAVNTEFGGCGNVIVLTPAVIWNVRVSDVAPVVAVVVHAPSDTKPIAPVVGATVQTLVVSDVKVTGWLVLDAALRIGAGLEIALSAG